MAPQSSTVGPQNSAGKRGHFFTISLYVPVRWQARFFPQIRTQIADGSELSDHRGVRALSVSSRVPVYMLEEQPPTWATAAPVRRVSFQGSQRQDALERKQRMPRHHQSRAAWRERQMGASLTAESKPKSEETLMQMLREARQIRDKRLELQQRHSEQALVEDMAKSRRSAKSERMMDAQMERSRLALLEHTEAAQRREDAARKAQERREALFLQEVAEREAAEVEAAEREAEEDLLARAPLPGRGTHSMRERSRIRTLRTNKTTTALSRSLATTQELSEAPTMSTAALAASTAAPAAAVVAPVVSIETATTTEDCRQSVCSSERASASTCTRAVAHRLSEAPAVSPTVPALSAAAPALSAAAPAVSTAVPAASTPPVSREASPVATEAPPVSTEDPPVAAAAAAVTMAVPKGSTAALMPKGRGRATEKPSPVIPEDAAQRGSWVKYERLQMEKRKEAKATELARQRAAEARRQRRKAELGFTPQMALASLQERFGPKDGTLIPPSGADAIEMMKRQASAVEPTLATLQDALSKRVGALRKQVSSSPDPINRLNSVSSAAWTNISLGCLEMRTSLRNKKTALTGHA